MGALVPRNGNSRTDFCSPGRQPGDEDQEQNPAPVGRKWPFCGICFRPSGAGFAEAFESWGFRPRLHASAPPGLNPSSYLLWAVLVLLWGLAECTCEELQQTDKAPRKVEISDIRLGYGIGQSLARRGAWFPISFEVSNPTERPYQGHLALTGPVLEHRQIAFYETRHGFDLSVPAETSKRFECYARALSGQSKDAFSRKKTKLELQIRSGLAPMMKVVEEIRTLTDGEVQVLEVNKSGVPILLGREYRYSDEERAEYITFGGKQVQRETIVPEAIKVGWRECATRVGDLPFRWVGYTSVDCVVWADGKMADLAPAQLHALLQFVQTGGTLIFYSGKDWSHGIGSVKEILPIESPTVLDVGSSVICTGEPRGGTLLLNVPGIGDRPMIYEMPYGMGTVSMLAFSGSWWIENAAVLRFRRYSSVVVFLTVETQIFEPANGRFL